MISKKTTKIQFQNPKSYFQKRNGYKGVDQNRFLFFYIVKLYKMEIDCDAIVERYLLIKNPIYTFSFPISVLLAIIVFGIIKKIWEKEIKYKKVEKLYMR